MIVMAKRLVTPKKKTLLITPKKKVAPASIVAQKTWGGLSKLVKNELRKTLPDRDRDGVPNGFDCRPRNRRKQEQFLPADQDYLDSNPSISLGEKLASGTHGDIYHVRGNRNLVVKVQQAGLGGELAYEKESRAYKYLDLNNEPLFIPTKEVEVKSQHGWQGLVRPKLAMITDQESCVSSQRLRGITDSQIESLRRKVINLSHKGFSFKDGLQIGRDVRGRLLLYDAGYFERHPEGSNEPFYENQSQWLAFLRKIGKISSPEWINNGYPTVEAYNEAMRKYGTINKQERYE